MRPTGREEREVNRNRKSGKERAFDIQKEKEVREYMFLFCAGGWVGSGVFRVYVCVCVCIRLCMCVEGECD